MSLRNVTLEVSLKPFHDTGPKAVREVCAEMFRQWSTLCRRADRVSVLIWASDGSEILDYQGDPDQEFEWAKYIGGANPREAIPGDPDGICLHSRSYLYRDDPPAFSYRWLANLVDTLKEIGREVTGKPIRVGATFDPGPEFAISSFKYDRHNEICLGNTMGRTSFVSCYGVIKGDSRRYAGFPEGVPEGTPFGHFFGRQSQCFLDDLGFDFLWLSNGFGFGTETWGVTGAIFDGETFATEKCDQVRSRILQFWRLFREQCPNYPIETRGTNLSTGMDLSSDAVSLRDIYAGGFGIIPPVNSPWAALNGDFGLELAGWMSHIAELPEKSGFPFRFYTHDPWWLNSPWLDRYARQPHDIYLPLSVGRINARGETEIPDSAAFLTVDDSYGRMPEQVPNEVIPHVIEALKDRPDAPGPVVWVYPFEEYHSRTFDDPSRIGEVFFGDWFIRGAINAGLPLNTVISTGALESAMAARPGLFDQSVLVTPAPDAATALSNALLAYVQGGGKVLLYGPMQHADPTWLSMLGLHMDQPLSGEFALTLGEEIDAVIEGEPMVIQHHEVFSAGGLCCAASNGDANSILATAKQGDLERVIAAHVSDPQWNGGNLAWVRGTLSCDPAGLKRNSVAPYPRSEVYFSEKLMRLALARLGIRIAFECDDPEQKLPLTCIARRDGAFMFSGYVPEQLVDVRMRMPAGAPLLQNIQTRIIGGAAHCHLPCAWHCACRVFIEQEEGILMSSDQPSIMVGVSYRYHISGLRDATVRFYPASEWLENVRMLSNPAYPHVHGDWVAYEIKKDARGIYLEAKGINGDLLISW